MATQKHKLKLKKGDEVIVIAGKDKGNVGNIIKLDRAKLRVTVSGINIQVKHQKPRQQGQPGQIFRQEGPIHYSNVLLYNPDTKKGERVSYKLNSDKSSKVRIFSKSKTEVKDK